MFQRSRALAAASGLTVLAALALAGCSKSSAGHPVPAPSAPTGANTPTVPITPSAPALALPLPEPSLEALVPNAQKSGTKLVVAVDPGQAPYAYLDSSGQVIGLSVDLFTEAAAKFGLTVDFVPVSGPAALIAGVRSGKYAAGLDSSLDTKAREKQVTVVDVLNVGTQWAERAGQTLTPSTVCGLKVAVFPGTVEATTDLPARTVACGRIGAPAVTVVPVTSWADATSALTNGSIDAIAADSTEIGYYVQQSNGALQLASPLYSAAPYGILVSSKSGTFAKGIQQAVGSLIADGNYVEIMAKWGTKSGSVSKVTINGAKK